MIWDYVWWGAQAISLVACVFVVVLSLRCLLVFRTATTRTETLACAVASAWDRVNEITAIPEDAGDDLVHALDALERATRESPLRKVNP